MYVVVPLEESRQHRNRHHIGARSRWKGKRQAPKVTLPVTFHDKWHALFGNMTPYEAVLFVEQVMNERTRQGWDRERLLALRVSILRYTEELRSRRRVDPLEVRAVRRNTLIRFDHVVGWWRELHLYLFGDLATVAEVATFITELMTPGSVWTGPQIVALRTEVRERRGLRVVVAVS